MKKSSKHFLSGLIASMLFSLFGCSYPQQTVIPASPNLPALPATRTTVDARAPAHTFSLATTPTETTAQRMASTQTITIHPAGVSPCSSWKLIWNDEFDGPTGSGPEATRWGFDTGGGGWGNQELEYYTDQTNNAYLDGKGNLVITALSVTNPQSSGLDCWYGPCRFTSARIKTGNNTPFTYGCVESRIQVPSGKGIWPAFWMIGSNYNQVGWPKCGEIDIMEINGGKPSILNGSLHGPENSGAYGINHKYALPEDRPFTDDYHVYSVLWEPETIRWYVDGHLYATERKSAYSGSQTWVFDHPFIIILDLAVGGDWPGNPDNSTTFTQSMYVDYVRVYQQP